MGRRNRTSRVGLPVYPPCRLGLGVVAKTKKVPAAVGLARPQRATLEATPSQVRSQSAGITSSSRVQEGLDMADEYLMVLKQSAVP